MDTMLLTQQGSCLSFYAGRISQTPLHVSLLPPVFSSFFLFPHQRRTESSVAVILILEAEIHFLFLFFIITIRHKV